MDQAAEPLLEDDEPEPEPDDPEPEEPEPDEPEPDEPEPDDPDDPDEEPEPDDPEPDPDVDFAAAPLSLDLPPPSLEDELDLSLDALIEDLPSLRESLR